MKTTRNVLFALLLLGVCAGAASAQVSVGAGVRVGPQGHASVDLGFFYDSLAPYGNWIERPSHGWVWTPREVSSTWRPYQAGHWVWSDEGWTWLSDEPYGWATYHYGRWYEDPEIGWAWVPGNDWAPAWVSWQEGNDYVGWAPLPPGANVNASNIASDIASNRAGPGYDNGPGPGYDGPDYDNNPGYDDEPGYDDNPGYDDGPAYEDDPGYEDGPAYDDNDRYDDRPVYGGGYGYGSYAYGIAPSAYLFVPTRVFLSVDLFDFYVPWVRVSSFFRLTRNCTSYGFYGGHYFNRGIAFEHVRRYYRSVPRYRLAGLDGFRGHGYHVEGNRLSFFRPQVSRGWRGSPLDRSGARRSVVSAHQFRNDHPDRQRSYAQNNGQRFGRTQRDNQRGNQRDNWQGYPSRQAQGDRSGRNAPRWQDQASRQRSFENGRAQADRQQRYNAQRQQQYNAQRQQQYNTQRWQQDQANRQRSYNRQRSQPQEGWQRRQYNVQPQQRQYQRQQQYQPRQQQPRQQQQRQQFQPQRQAPPRQQYRNNDGRGQANPGQNHHGNDRRRHGG